MACKGSFLIQIYKKTSERSFKEISMNTLTFLLYTTGGLGLLCFFAELTSRAEAYVNRVAKGSTAGPPVAAHPEPQAANKKETASYWWGKVSSAAGMFGLLMTPLLLPILAINSYIIALNLEVMFGQASEALFTMSFLGWEREITLLDLLALLCSLGQIIAASVSFKTRKAAESDRWLTNLGRVSMAALLVLLSFEVGSAFYRGFEMSGSENGLLSAGLALGVGVITAAVGIFVIDQFVIPLLLALCYTVAAPFRLAAAGGKKFNLSKTGSRIILFFAHIFAAIDRSLMAPLRRLDAWVYALLFERKSRSARESRGAAKNLSKTAVGILLLTVAFGLTACEFSAKKPSRTWICALDVTTSIDKQDFTIMRDKWMTETCLSRLARGDEIHTLPVNSDPEKNVEVRTIGGGKRSGAYQDIMTVYEFVRANLVQPKGYKGTTNIGGVLAYAKRLGKQVTDAPEKARKNGSSIVVVIFSDGKLEGSQTLEGGEWPKGVSVWFFGVNPHDEDALKKFATDQVGVPPGQLKLVRMSDWHTMVKVFGETIGRPHQNQEFLRAVNGSSRPLALAGAVAFGS